MVELDADVGIGGEGVHTAFLEAAFAAIEAVSFRIPPEFGHEVRVIERVLVQSGERSPGQITDGKEIIRGAVEGQGPDFLRVQRCGVIRIYPAVHARFPGIDGDGVQDSVRIVPLGLTDGRCVNIRIGVE